MAISVAIETAIDRPSDVVFAALVDIERWPSWLIATGIVAVSRDAPGSPIATGEHVTVDQRAQGRAARVQAIVTILEPPSHFAIDGRDADGVRTTLDARLLSEAGGTRLRWSVRIDLPLRYRAFESMAAPLVHKATELDVEAFKRRLESRPAD